MMYHYAAWILLALSPAVLADSDTTLQEQRRALRPLEIYAEVASRCTTTLRIMGADGIEESPDCRRLVSDSEDIFQLADLYDAYRTESEAYFREHGEDALSSQLGMSPSEYLRDFEAINTSMQDVTDALERIAFYAD